MRTKTDRENKGVTLNFFRTGQKCCPVAALSAYLTGRRGGGMDSPLFTDSKGKTIRQEWVIARMRGALDRAGLEGKDFSGISLRRGGAQTLLGKGASDKVIMSLGRWRTTEYRKYLAVDSSDVSQWQAAMAS